MQQQEFIGWLKSQGIFQVARANYPKFTNILTDLLKVRRRDIILIVTDSGLPGKRSAPLMAACYLLAAKRLGLSARLVVQKPKSQKDRVEADLICAIKNLQEDNFIIGTASERLGSFSQLGSSFKRLVTMRRHKFVLTTLLQELPTKKFNILLNSMSIDYKALQAKALSLKRTLDTARKVEVITDKGTSLNIGIAGMKAYINDGKGLTSGGNIPVGEVYIAPRKNQVEGVAVIDGSVRTKKETILVRKPVQLLIRNGQVVRISGDKEASALRKAINSILKTSSNTWGVKRIGELGIGLNPAARVCGPNIINEKTLGTAHIAIGSNATFGGTVFAPLHLDQVFHKPRIYVDGRRINVS